MDTDYKGTPIKEINLMNIELELDGDLDNGEDVVCITGTITAEDLNAK